jgi:hypothetical protein
MTRARARTGDQPGGNAEAAAEASRQQGAYSTMMSGGYGMMTGR